MYFAPVATSWVAVSVIWRLVLHPDGAAEPGARASTSTGSRAPARRAGRSALTAIWKEVGFFVIIFLAGLQNVPRELHEAASLDGAGPVARLRYITLPLIKPVSAVVAVMAVIRGFQSFSPQVVLTGGSFDTEVVNLFVYKTAFASARMGRASAVAVLMFVLLRARHARRSCACSGGPTDDPGGDLLAGAVGARASAPDAARLARRARSPLRWLALLARRAAVRVGRSSTPCCRRSSRRARCSPAALAAERVAAVELQAAVRAGAVRALLPQQRRRRRQS